MNEYTFLYITYACASGIAGLLRFLESKKKFGWRTVTTSILLSVVTSIGIIGYFFDSQISTQPTKYLSLSMLIGYVQPNVVSLVGFILKGIGVNKEDEV